MKKIIVLAIFVIAVSTVKAQHSFGIQAGATLANVKQKFGGESEQSDSKFGLMAGVVGNVMLSNHIAFRPELNYVSKGGKNEDNSTDVTVKTSLNYLELPLDFVYNTTPNKSGKFFIGLGPSIDCALYGKSKLEGSTVTNSESNIHFGNESGDDLKRFELSLNTLVGYEFTSGLFVSGSFNEGLTDLIPGEQDGSFRNQYFSLKLGYMLHSAKK